VASLAGCTYDWKPGDWSDYSSTCSATATRTRGVACMRTDQTVADSEARCQAGTKPALSETADVSTSCTYAWNYSAWNVVPACGDTTQSRTASCRRSDGTDGGTHCAGQTQDALSGTVYDTQTCGYSWKPGDWSNYSSTCSDAATRTRSEACVRSDNQPVDAALCAGKTHNNLSETAGVYSSCGHAWKYGAWVSASTCSNSTTQTRTATCMRTINGADVPVSDSWCSGQPKVDTQTGISDTSSCSTAWSYSSWVSTAPASTCTQNQAQTRTATCMAAIPSGGSVPVADGRCDPALKQALSQTVDVSSSCTWAWNPNDNATSTWAFGDTTTGWTGWSNTCGAATRTRTVQCVRSDGKVETGTGQSNCTASRPASTQNSTQTTDCGGNLVNGNFETGTSAGWTFDSVADTKGNKVYPFVQTNTVHSGSYSVAMPNTNQGNGAITTYLQQSFPTKAGANCSASVWMYGSNAQPTFTILNSSGVEVVSVNASSGWNQKSGSFVGNGSPFTVKIYTRGLSTSVTRVDDVVISCTP